MKVRRSSDDWQELLLLTLFTVSGSRDTDTDNQEKFAAIMKTPFSTLSEEEIQFFLTYKESQYAIRRKRIEDFCSIQDENFGRKIIKNSLVYDKGSLKYVPFNYVSFNLLQMFFS